MDSEEIPEEPLDVLGTLLQGLAMAASGYGYSHVQRDSLETFRSLTLRRVNEDGGVDLYPSLSIHIREGEDIILIFRRDPPQRDSRKERYAFPLDDINKALFKIRELAKG